MVPAALLSEGWQDRGAEQHFAGQGLCRQAGLAFRRSLTNLWLDSSPTLSLVVGGFDPQLSPALGVFIWPMDRRGGSHAWRSYPKDWVTLSAVVRNQDEWSGYSAL